MFCANDVMTTDVVVVREDTPVLEALELCLTHRISGIPVVDHEERIVGMLSERDMLKLHKAGNAMYEQTVSDYMTQPAIFFEEYESLWDICACLSQHYIRRVPITRRGRVVGIVSAKDVLHTIMRVAYDSSSVYSSA